MRSQVIGRHIHGITPMFGELLLQRTDVLFNICEPLARAFAKRIDDVILPGLEALGLRSRRAWAQLVVP